MKKVMIALATLTALVMTGCEKHPTAPPVVEMSSITELCLQIDQDLAKAATEQGLDENHYHSSECGTPEQRKAFSEGNYVVVK